MQTREIAHHLAEAARHFPLLGSITQENLMDLVRIELGHEEILNEFRPYGDAGNLTRAVGPRILLHIISGNTPHAGLQSLIRGLLLDARNWCKIPCAGLPEIAEFREYLPFELARRIEIDTQLPGHWLAQADAVVVFGSDDTVEHFRSRVLAGQRFLRHGHRFSFGVVFDDPQFESIEGAARDASLFDQQGCLSPHIFYVPAPMAREYASRLAEAMAAFEKENPRGPLTVAEHTEINALRGEFGFRAATDPEAGIWQSPDSTAWTVLLDPDSHFSASCLNRVVYVKPLPDDLDSALLRARLHLSTVGIYPVTPENCARVASSGVSRICPIGKMQLPPVTWHHDGRPVLAPLVRWIDFEVA